LRIIYKQAWQGIINNEHLWHFIKRFRIMDSGVSNILERAPICLFTYNRLQETIKTVTSLQKNYLAAESEIFIFTDGPKSTDDKSKVNAVLDFANQIVGFKKVHHLVSDSNKGLSNSIIEGVTQVIDQNGRAIVLEDDLVTSPNFLDYMNQALEFYQGHERLFSISGYTYSLNFPKAYALDHYFSVRGSSWGWATWKNRWKTVDWSVSDYREFLSSKEKQQSFNRGGSDLTNMLKNQMEGKINSWAIRWCYQQWKNNQLTVYPTVSKIQNIGFSKSASNTRYRIKEYIAELDQGINRNFSFSNSVTLNHQVLSLFQSNFSIVKRLKNKLLKTLNV